MKCENNIYNTPKYKQMSFIKVSQYNILCPKLANANYFPTCSSKDLQWSARYKRLCDKISEEIRTNSVICLQEIPRSWTGDFIDFFAIYKYVFIYSPYGYYKNDNMGVGIAYPSDIYSSSNTKIIQVSNSLPIVYKPRNTIVQNIFGWMLAPFTFIKNKLIKGKSDPWEEAVKKYNTLVMTTLTNKENKQTVIGTYHMPCVFWDPHIMTIHTIEVVKQFQNYSKDIPAVLAGDFNFMPTSYQYKCITDKVDISHKEYPPDAKKWKSDIIQMSSAYKNLLGEEPKYTNYAQTSNMNKIFSETLDYIFYFNGLTPVEVSPIPELPMNGSFPNEDEPSDHILLSATFVHE